MAARIPSPPPERLLEYDDGLHLGGTILWFDAPRDRDLCFLSHAAVEDLPVHRKVLATPGTFELLEHGLGAALPLPCPYFRPFFLGELELELIPSGFLHGAAQLLVTWRKTRILYARSLAVRAGRVADPLRIRRCDVLVLDAPLGRPGLRVPPREQVEAELLDFVQESLHAGQPPVLLADRLGLSQEVLALLLERGLPVRCHPAIARKAAVLQAQGRLAAAPEKRGALRADEVLLWPLAARQAPTLTSGAARPCLAALGLDAVLDPERLRREEDVERTFPLTRHADLEELVTFVQATGASSVLLVGGFTAPLRDRLLALGIPAEELLPPTQTELPTAG
ncbi:MAG: hypothetical protein RBU45_16980 [Myxococcota bacterium]|jgi:putative mRNA 3-end processing factor|nr:hypothetical protein [Myxococcota bacterium]